MTTPFKWGAEFLINTTTVGDQSGSSVIGLADGRFLAAWVDEGAQSGLRQQYFSATGAKIGAQITVSTAGAGTVNVSPLAQLADGGFIVARSDGALGATAQGYNLDGSIRGVVSFGGSTSAPSVAALADGGFVVVYYDVDGTLGDASGGGIHGQRYSAEMEAIGPEFLVNTQTGSDQIRPDITALSNGGFVVTWTDVGVGGRDVRAQVYGANGARVGAEIAVNTISASIQEHASITELADGRFVIAWKDVSRSPDDTSDDAVRAQVFFANGSKSGLEFLVNTVTTSNQNQPSLQALADGRFMAVWKDVSQIGGDASADGIKGQVFNADGTKSGLEFLVNTTVSLTQSLPNLTELADGRVMISWNDESSGNLDVRGQIFDPRIAAITLNGTLAADGHVGTIFADHLGGGFGNDTLRGERGDDHIAGGAGNDLLAGGYGNDQMFGGDGNDGVYGGLGWDVMEGGAGNDSLDGGLGLDLMVGGAGNDRYTLSDRGDVVQEAALGGIDTVVTGAFSVNLALYAQVENVALTGLLELEVLGSAAANALVGNEAGNVLEGAGGNDTLNAGGGADQLYGGAGLDSLYGGLGADILSGDADQDRLYGGDGDDDLNGGVGHDLVSGGNGNDTLLGDQIGLVGAGNDTLSGGAGDDVLNGFTGVDLMYGGSGADQFQFFLGYGKDRVVDFVDGVDRIDLRAWGFATATVARTHFADIGGKLVFTMGVDVLTIDNMTKAQISAVDLIL